MNGQIPKWQREIESFKGIKSLFLLEGNIYDQYPWYQPDRQKYLFCNLNEILDRMFDSGSTEGAYDFLFYDPAFGFTSQVGGDGAEIAGRLDGARGRLAAIKEELRSFNAQADDARDPLVRDSEIIRTAISEGNGPSDSGRSVAVVVNYASRLLSQPDNPTPGEMAFFLNLQYAAGHAKSGNGSAVNTLILVSDKFGDVPSWVHQGNPNVRKISVPNPDRDARRVAIEKYYTFDTERQKEQYIDLTDGMQIVELQEMEALLRREGAGIGEISELISIYKYGFKENRWLQIRGKLRTVDLQAEIHKRVKGQDEAVEKAVQIIKRSVVGLSGMQHSSNTKPKGILFLVGPTGTGKTELVKTITKLLFEDERSLIRFDMSEYSEENSDQKLFGAPPGYVGYGQGGQLTNAVRRNPFSVLLFDEIEKAHPSIMDKFLQILEDGRMTDGQGSTVYFSETVIFFTSNKGISEEEFDPLTGRLTGRRNIVRLDEPYEKLKEEVFAAVRKYFKPEVIGRIGENNIIAFNYISAEVADQITDSVVGNINANLAREQRLSIAVDGAAMDWLRRRCREERYRASGGRGIGNAIEEWYLNPLADFLFDNDCQPGDTVRISTGGGGIVFAKG